MWGYQGAPVAVQRLALVWRERGTVIAAHCPVGGVPVLVDNFNQPEIRSSSTSMCQLTIFGTTARGRAWHAASHSWRLVPGARMEDTTCTPGGAVAASAKACETEGGATADALHDAESGAESGAGDRTPATSQGPTAATNTKGAATSSRAARARAVMALLMRKWLPLFPPAPVDASEVDGTCPACRGRGVHMCAHRLMWTEESCVQQRRTS